MRLISIKKYDEATMQLAAPIYDAKRRLLLGKGQIIHPKYKERLVDIGIDMIIVDDEISKGITLDDMLEIPTWMDAIGDVQVFYETVKKGAALPFHLLHRQANILVSEIKRRKAIMLTPSTSLSSELKLYGHIVNVTLLALQTAKRLNYNDFKLRDLAMGCLLHDIGKMKTEQELEHPAAGFELLRKNQEISLLSAHVAFQHHEKLDGSGYPQQLKGDRFHEYAQICAVANQFENATIKEKVHPHMAMEMIMTLAGRTYAKEVVDAFVWSVPSYPPGTKVQLHSGEDAIVTRIDSSIHRPVVRLTESKREISLYEHPTIMIQAVGE